MQKQKTSTLEILGNADRYKIASKWKPQYRRLLEIRDTLLYRKGESSDAARQEAPTFSLHMADAGTDQYDQDFALSMMSSEQSALYEVEQAINRIRDGTYGICELTGQEIEKERLDAIPWARFSLNAQSDLENRGAFTRTKLAEPGSLTHPNGSGREDEDTEEEES